MFANWITNIHIDYTYVHMQDVAYVSVHISRNLKPELALATDQWLWVISNIILFKTAIPLQK